MPPPPPWKVQMNDPIENLFLKAHKKLKELASDPKALDAFWEDFTQHLRASYERRVAVVGELEAEGYRIIGGASDILEDMEHRGCDHEANAPHTCPYRVDIGNDSQTLCTCCDECQRECAMDI